MADLLWSSVDDMIMPSNKTMNTDVMTTGSKIGMSTFECNICLDFAQDPVVTLCGHLYCWPCIYEWLLRLSSTSSRNKKCPVCNFDVSISSLVPLYGHGSIGTKNKHQIPPRPSFLSEGHRLTQPIDQTSDETEVENSRQRHLYRTLDDYVSASSWSFEGATTRILQETAIKVGWMAVMILPWIFRRHMSGLDHHERRDMVIATGRRRFQDLQREKSLNRLFTFLFCFVIMCLLLF